MIATSPGSGQELFEKFDELGLTDPVRTASFCFESGFDSIQNDLDAVRMSSPYVFQPLESPFSFLSSTSLSGEGNPCFDQGCRIGRARGLTRFASLYSDVVLIKDPFDRIFHSEDNPGLRLDLFNTLAVLNELGPAIRAGLIAFSPTNIPLSDEGRALYKKFESQVMGDVQGAADLVLEAVTRSIETAVKSTDSYNYLSLTGVDAYIPHEDLDIVPMAGHVEWKKNHLLSEAESKAAVKKWIVDPTVSDLVYSRIINWLLKPTYLTDRPVDFQVLERLGNSGAIAPQQVIPKVNHALPFIDGLDTDTIIRLRQEEGEAFQVYRESVKGLVSNHDLTQQQFQESFRDLVQPELNRIDKAVRSANRLSSSTVRSSLLYGTGLVTIGLSVGSINPEAGAIATALGGVKLGAELFERIGSRVFEPATAFDSDFYFLWKAREHNLAGH